MLGKQRGWPSSGGTPLTRLRLKLKGHFLAFKLFVPPGGLEMA